MQLLVTAEDKRIAYLERRQRQLLRICEMQSRLAKANFNLSDFMQVAVDQLKDLIDADGVVVELVEGAEMVYRATDAAHAEHLGLRLSRSDSLSGLCVARREVLHCVDSESDPRVDREACRAVGIRAMICAPLFEDEQAVGALKAFSPRADAFSDDDVEALALVADTLGAALGKRLAHQNRQTLMDERAETLAMLSKARDVAEERARRAEMAESMGGLGHWRYDIASQESTWSPLMCDIHGVPRGAAPPSQMVAAMIHPDDRERVGRHMRQGLERRTGSESVVFRIRRADGEERYLEASTAVELDASGAPAALVGAARDVTERRLAAQVLAQSEARYRLLADNARDMIVHADLEGRLTYVSPSAREKTGRPAEAWVGCSILDFAHPDHVEQFKAAIALQMKAERPERADRVEFRGLHADGREIWLEARPVAAFDPITGALTGVTDVIRDVTTRHIHEAELRDARREAESAARVKAEFLANMTHELRTPLTAVLGFSRLIEKQPDLTAETRLHLGRVLSAGEALLYTINDILDFSKLEAGQVEIRPRPASVRALARETIDLLMVQAAEKRIDLRLEIADETPELVLVDPERIRQVLLNLVGNAVKFTDEGEVCLSIKPGTGVDRLEFSVSDTGPGVPTERLARLFQRFSQVDGGHSTSQPGTGLGLAICKGLVEAMGGEIGVESQLGQGSRFWFVLSAPVAADAAPIEDGAAGVAGRRVLVVDDNAANRMLVRSILSTFGALVEEASDGLEAVAMAGRGGFDLVLMDLRMPGLDGVEAARRIRAASGPGSRAPILAFSADREVDLCDGLFLDVVAKPIDPEALLLAVARGCETFALA
jgi:PAS domain S-box-containing protein